MLLEMYNLKFLCKTILKVNKEKKLDKKDENR